MSTIDPNDLIMGGGSQPAKFETIGTIVRGEILAERVTQMTKFGTTELRFWPNGEPMYQVIYTLQTDERDPSDDSDDGQRDLYIDSKNKKAALRAAVIAAGVNRIELGGYVAMQYTGDDPNGKNPANPPKLYVAQYRPPSRPADDALLTSPPSGPVAATSLIP